MNLVVDEGIEDIGQYSSGNDFRMATHKNATKRDII